jgi:hypothetical protein
MTFAIGITLIVFSIGIAVFWLVTGKRNKPLFRFVCLLTVITGFLLILKDRLLEITLRDVVSIKTSAAKAEADAESIAAIKKQVENQRAIIDLVATEAQNAVSLSEEASNKTTLAEQKLKSLDEAVQKAKNSLKRLDGMLDFTLLVNKAQCGDRGAFFTLLSRSFDTGAEAGYVILNTIALKVELDTVLKSEREWLWGNFGIDPHKATLQEFQEYYSKTFSSNPSARSMILKQVFNDRRFSELERFDFIATAMQQDNNLEVLQEACLLMNAKKKSNQNFTHVDDYLSWYRDNRAGFKTTP